MVDVATSVSPLLAQLAEQPRSLRHAQGLPRSVALLEDENQLEKIELLLVGLEIALDRVEQQPIEPGRIVGHLVSHEGAIEGLGKLQHIDNGASEVVVFHPHQQDLEVVVLLLGGESGTAVEVIDRSAHVVQGFVQSAVFGQFPHDGKVELRPLARLDTSFGLDEMVDILHLLEIRKNLSCLPVADA